MFKAAGILFGGGMAGKVLGFVRDVVMAAVYGTSDNVDAFRASQTGMLIPAHFLIGEGLNAGFIPLYARYHREDPDRAHAFFWLMTAGMTGLSCLMAALLCWLAGAWMRLLVPGYTSEAFRLTVIFTQVTAISLPFYVQGTLFSHLEIANGRFFLASVRASVQNVGITASILAAVWLRQPILLAWGFTGSYIVFCALGVWCAWREGLVSWPDRWSGQSVRPVIAEFWRTVRPVLFLPVVIQLNSAVERIVASKMGSGVVASMEYARNISESGLVLVAWPIGLAGLAEFSRMEFEDARAKLQRILPLLFLILLPASAFLALNSEGIIRLVYGRGRFDAESIRLTYPIFTWLAAGFWAQVISYVLVRTLNAQLRNVQVAMFVCAGLAVNVFVNLLAYGRLGPMVLGLSTAVGSLVTLLLAGRAMKLGASVSEYGWSLLIGTALYLPLGWLTRGAGLQGLIVASVVAAVYWGLFVWFVPPWRNVCTSIWRYRKTGDVSGN